jgi:hypothetical protein
MYINLNNETLMHFWELFTTKLLDIYGHTTFYDVAEFHDTVSLIPTEDNQIIWKWYVDDNFDKCHKKTDFNINDYALKTNFYDRTTTDAKYQLISNMWNFYDKTASDAKYQLISNMWNYYDKTTTDAKYALKTDLNTVNVDMWLYYNKNTINSM